MRTLLKFFRWFGAQRSQGLQYIGSALWKPYRKVIAKKAGQAVHVLDRFPILSHLGKALDEVRAQEARALKAKGYEPVLTQTRRLLLKRPENLTRKQEIKRADLLPYNLRSVRAYLLREAFPFFRGSLSPYRAGRFLDRWGTRTMRSKIGPMKKVARMLCAHHTLLLNGFHAKGRLSSGVVEGSNTKTKLTPRKSFGFRTYHGAEIALCPVLGALPEPEFTRGFCRGPLV